MSSTNYQIKWDTLNSGGSDSGSSNSYLLRDQIGSVSGGNSSSTSFNLRSGYRQGVFDEMIDFEVFGISATNTNALSVSSTTVSVSDASSFSTGDMIVLIEDKGSSQIEAIGKVTSTTASTVVVDSWSNNGTQPTIDGTGDYVYLLSGTSVALGTLSSGVVGTGMIAWDISIENNNGYTISVVEDGNLRSGANDIDDVSDGAVTAGSEEYGARSSDTSLANSTFDTQDSAITTSTQEVATESSAQFASRNFLTLKASYASGTPEATYTHIISVIAAGNF